MNAYYYLFQYGKVLIDQAAMGILGKERFKVKFHEGERLYDLAQKRRGIILLTTHAGSWQAAMATMDPMENRVHFVFNEKDNAGLHFFNLSHQRDKFQIILPDSFFGGLIEAFNALKAGEVVAIMGDRAFGNRTIDIDFLGEKAPFPITPYHLAHAAGADVVVLLTVRTGKLAFAIECNHISEGLNMNEIRREEAIKLLAQRYVSCLEDYARKNPYMWFNFFDFWNTEKRIVK